MRRPRWKILVGLLAVLIAAAAVILPLHVRRPPQVAALPAHVATRPSTARTTTTAGAISPPTYLDLIRRENPLIAATQPLELPVDLPDAAHVIVHEPVYFDGMGQLWMTATGAASAEAAMNDRYASERLLNEHVRFVDWNVPTADGTRQPPAIVVESTRDTFQLLRAESDSKDRLFLGGARSTAAIHVRRFPIPIRRYRWSAAFSWNNLILVPDEQGITAIDVTAPNLAIQHDDLVSGRAGVPIMMPDGRGILAWISMPALTAAADPFPHVARFVDGAWSDVSKAGWLPRPLQLIPLLDGSVLEIAAGSAARATEDDTVRLVIIPLDGGAVDDEHVTRLVSQLGDADQDRRQAAFDELSRYGPSVLPRLTALADQQPPEIRLRLRQLLRGKAAPALAGMELIDNRLQVAKRCVDGSVLLFAPAGVRVPLASGDWDTVTPAWMVLRPDGRFDRPLPANLAGDQNPATPTLSAFHDEWLLTDAAGVRRWDGVTFAPLLSEAEARFSKLVGIDHRGRWVFTTLAGDDTLLIDPTLADPTPKLPAWAMTIDHGSVGWDSQDWPCIKRGGAFALQADHWEPLADTEVMHEAPVDDAPLMPPSTGPSTRPALLVSADGTRYFGGNEAIETNRGMHWDLPSVAVGTSTSPVLLRTEDGRLFLFNQPGRCVCLQPTPTRGEPFTVAATFTHGIPNSDVGRIWLDPAGRIDIVYQHNKLVVLFPSGHIPPEIENMITN